MGLHPGAVSAYHYGRTHSISNDNGHDDVYDDAERFAWIQAVVQHEDREF